ncbi:MAG: mechanosensitive ion channel family protein, partial [Kiritimatiellae bacterium]|nr:mechanosensitive ion channel family protein [Kiritimatiellia bacterium]
LKSGERLTANVRKKVWFRGFLYPVALPALVLVFSYAAAWLAAHCPGACAAWMEHCRLHFEAWQTFWWVILGMRAVEGVCVSFFWFRGKAFPVPSLIVSIVRTVIALLAAFLVLKEVAGVNIAPLLASTALVTAVIGFALQGVLGNLLGGMSLHLVRSLVPGDWIRVEGIEGEVIETNWRETRLRTHDGHVMIVPNSTVSSAVLNHMSWPNTLRRHRFEVGASYSDAPGNVIRELIEAARETPNVLEEPKPDAFITEYKDFGINYVVRYWTRRYYDRRELDGEVARRIWYRFKRKGIEIPFPMSDKLLNDFMAVVYRQRREPPEEKEVLRMADDLERSRFSRDLLTGVDGVGLLCREEYVALARHARRVFYTTGEVLFRQREEGDRCYIVVRGLLNGEAEGCESPAGRHVFEIKSGALLGEMSLLTGLPRTATVRAVEECELIELDADAFTYLLGMKPDIPERLAELASERAAALKTELERMKDTEGTSSRTLGKSGLLDRFLRMIRTQRNA